METKSLPKKFNQISTQWGVIQSLLEQEDGVRNLAEYLTLRYYHPLAEWAKKFQTSTDDFSIYELTSEVFMEFLKNDCEKLKNLDQQKDHLRALLTTILKRKISKDRQKKAFFTLEEEEGMGQVLHHYQDFWLDFQGTLERMKKERFLAYKAFLLFHLEGRSLKETAEVLKINENAVAQRVHTARSWLRKNLKDYQKG